MGPLAFLGLFNLNKDWLLGGTMTLFASVLHSLSSESSCRFSKSEMVSLRQPPSTECCVFEALNWVTLQLFFKCSESSYFRFMYRSMLGREFFLPIAELFFEWGIDTYLNPVLSSAETFMAVLASVLVRVKVNEVRSTSLFLFDDLCETKFPPCKLLRDF